MNIVVVCRGIPHFQTVPDGDLSNRKSGFKPETEKAMKSMQKLSVIIWCDLAGAEWIFIRGVVAQHGFRER